MQCQRYRMFAGLATEHAVPTATEGLPVDQRDTVGLAVAVGHIGGNLSLSLPGESDAVRSCY